MDRQLQLEQVQKKNEFKGAGRRDTRDETSYQSIYSQAVGYLPCFWLPTSSYHPFHLVYYSHACTCTLYIIAFTSIRIRLTS